jgi:hypothetical protein
MQPRWVVVGEMKEPKNREISLLKYKEKANEIEERIKTREASPKRGADRLFVDGVTTTVIVI